MDRPAELRALARKCRDLAAGITDDDTRNSLELLARDYEARAAEAEAEAEAEGGGEAKAPRPAMPKPE